MPLDLPEGETYQGRERRERAQRAKSVSPQFHSAIYQMSTDTKSFMIPLLMTCTQL